MVKITSESERRRAQLALYVPEEIERSLMKAANSAGGEYAAAIGMIQGTAYTVRMKGATVAAQWKERLDHIQAILDALNRVTGPTDLAVAAARVGAGLDARGAYTVDDVLDEAAIHDHYDIAANAGPSRPDAA